MKRHLERLELQFSVRYHDAPRLIRHLSSPAWTLARRARRATLVIATLAGVAATPRRATCEHPAPATPDAATASPDAATAESGATASELLRTGLRESKKGNFEAARIAFEKTWRLLPHPEVTASLAEVEMKLGRYREAAEHWDYYLAHDPPGREEAEARRAECRQHLADIHATVDPLGATLFLDGNVVAAEAPASEIWVEPGAHTLYAELNGQQSKTEQVTVQAGDTRAVTLSVSPPELKPRASAQAPRRPLPVADRPAPVMGREPPYTLLITGGALTFIALETAFMSMYLANQADAGAARFRELAIHEADPEQVRTNSFCKPKTSICEGLDRDIRFAAIARNVEYGAFIGAGVFGAATVATYLIWAGQKKSGEKPTVAVSGQATRSTQEIRLSIDF